MKAIWRGKVIADSDRTLEVDGTGPEFIRTVSRHGYQFAHAYTG